MYIDVGKYRIGDNTGKRIAGQIQDSKWLVVTESTHLDNDTWQHKCGTLLKGASVYRAIWSNNKPRCRFCGVIFPLPLPDDLLLCPNCGSLRTGEAVGIQAIEIVYCPQCETQPQTILPKFIVKEKD